MKLKVTFRELSQKLPICFGELNQKLPICFEEVQTVTKYIGGEKYEGDYGITPKVEAQTMPTKNKVMIDDVTVKAIPFFNVSNNSGGSTVYIGTEV